MALKNILLVDDDLPSRRLADITLQDAKVPCVIRNAKDGKEAIEMLENCDESPNVILRFSRIYHF
jgi:CheY-like chemotaxis protein